MRIPPTDGDEAEGYWGIPCQVTLEHDRHRAVRRGRVVLGGPYVAHGPPS